MSRKYYVFILNHPPCRAIALQGDLKFPDFVAAVGNEFQRNVEGVEFRRVDREPNPRNATELFTTSAGIIDDTESLTQDGVVYIVGKLAEGPAGAAGGAAGGGAAGAGFDYGKMARVFRDVLREELSEGDTVATPDDYEESCRQYIETQLERRFGLRMVEGSRPHREAGDGPPVDGKPTEWDFRVPVTTSTPATHPKKGSGMLIFPDCPAYVRPPRPARARRLTPTEAAGSDAPPGCDYMAIFEITTSDKWAKELFPRMEGRLRVSLDRAREQGTETNSILDVCAVIGVVSPFDCQRSVSDRVKASTFPLLFEMMSQARFVFLRRSYSPISPPSSQGPGSGHTGDASAAQ